MEKQQVERKTFYTKYKANDGTEFLREEDCILHEKILRGDAKLCETCKGSGHINERTSISMQAGYSPEEYTISDRCPDCKGKGFLEKVWK